MMGTKNNPGEFDCFSKLDGDEPYFVLRGRDPIAHILIAEWAHRRATMLSRDFYNLSRNEVEREIRKINEAMKCSTEMLAYFMTQVTVI